MAIIRFTPFRSPFSDLSLLQNRLDSMFQDFEWSAEQNEALTTGNFVPPVDVYEDSQKVILKLEVPGIKQDDLDVRLEDQILTVKGDRKFEKEEKEENFHRIERRYGSFVRSFTVPQTVDTESVAADYNTGVLTITLNKKAEAKPKQVKIKVGSSSASEQAAKQVEAA
ncbi:Hsp20/alpha crystallin family protein [Edaphobacter albus]|uniref:Hsp20/alpha crystallin family protein n=1 Tax=Edaphobacter sp. 4G125 TaxID=2763071 RepID=UPI001646F8D8|nr:Hsp20/alpha crystallin family protein [Edaphobacter sp. 4G125]QNI36867.1 Hsp20/alpha crystallin family protein [Edaphobacter sp. 4G125]